MTNLFPAPADTPISDDSKYSWLRFGTTWMRYLKALGDMLLESLLVQNTPATSVTGAGLTQLQINTAAKAFKYTLNGNVVFVTYYREDTAPTVPLTVQLPYTAKLAFDIQGTVYPAGTKQISIPATTGYTRFWFVAQATKGAQ